MSLRKIASVTDAAFPGHSAAVYRDSEWQEFRVVLDGNRESAAFEDDKESALRTARALIRAAAKQSDIAWALDAMQAPAGFVADAIAAVNANRMPAAICWIDGLCLRSCMCESSDRFGIVTVLPANYFVA